MILKSNSPRRNGSHHLLLTLTPPASLPTPLLRECPGFRQRQPSSSFHAPPRAPLAPSSRLLLQIPSDSSSWPRSGSLQPGSPHSFQRSPARNRARARTSPS